MAGQGGKQDSKWKDPTAQSRDDVVGPGNGEWDVGDWRGVGEELSLLNVELSMSWALEGCTLGKRKRPVVDKETLPVLKMASTNPGIER